MTTKIINNFNSLNSKELSTIKGGACSFLGATAAVGVGTVSGGVFGAWSGAGLGMATFCGV